MINYYVCVQKQRSPYTDRLILHKKPVKCKQVDDGCQWEGTIHDYQITVSSIRNFIDLILFLFPVSFFFINIKTFQIFQIRRIKKQKQFL